MRPGLSSGAVASREVAALAHEVGDDPVEAAASRHCEGGPLERAFEGERLARLALALNTQQDSLHQSLLSRAERPEIP